MVTVAIAGGTGGVGRAVSEAIKSSQHKAIILTRKACMRHSSQNEYDEDIGLPIIAVDYDDVDALTKVLEKYQIHTVISALALHIHGVGKSQVNLIRAADKSPVTKRFVASSWAVRAPEKYLDLLPHGYQHTAAYAELEKTTLEWTAFNVGWFLEYYGMPYVKTYIPQTTFVVDMANKWASIPGDGQQLMTFTYSRDVAKFVVAALDVPKWDNDTIVVGDKMTWVEFVKLAEEARGAKFTVVYDSVNKLKAGEITELPGQVTSYSYFPKEWAQKLFSVFGYWVTEGVFDIPDEKALNKVFPDIYVTTVKEMLDQCWKGK
ncbi:NAD(P)-binding protein [Melanomma pulvis-pyrius CBS 109.77]|uniref:NAD(P)-binding protein n=1 Tax=Melanomma pulvis-pyrius CBS 109.77 TaxID=1314802 RepID=A0A6A6XBL5_9PLEO|nr:NAD(P)-binding protein [Melanomma pulvis-pyrius CBS 109.77]